MDNGLLLAAEVVALICESTNFEEVATMQKLDVVSRLSPLIVAGEKTSTIRYGETRIVIGPLVYWSDGNSSINTLVWVHGCSEMLLSNVAAYLGKEEDWPDEIMLEGMREHYPTIQLDSTVQVVEHYSPMDSATIFVATRTFMNGSSVHDTDY